MKVVLTKTGGGKQRSQKKDVEAEILRNIDEEVFTFLIRLHLKI